MKKVVKAIGILVCGILAGALLLIAAYCLPLSMDHPNVSASMQMLEEENMYPTLPLIKSYELIISRLNEGGVLDNYTDSIMISAAGMETDGRPWYQAMNAKNCIKEEGYAYYWHGYAVILRPLLLLFDYAEIRVLNEMAQFLLVLGLFYLIKRRKGFKWAMVSLSVYGLLFPMALAYSLQYSGVFYISTIGSIFLFLLEDFWKKKQNIYWFFLVTGMVTSYFDLLTYPLMTWAMPMIWWIVLDEEEHTECSRIRTIVIGGVLWILGYGGMWAGKWIIGELILGKPVIRSAYEEILLRAGSADEGGEAISRLMTLQLNYIRCDSVQYVVILGAWFVWLVYQLIVKKVVLRPNKSLAFSLIAASIFVWYMVLHNHSYVHNWFVYRLFAIFFIAILAGFLSVKEYQVSGGQRKKRLAKYLPLVLISVCSVMISLAVEKEVWNHNGGAEIVGAELGAGQCVEQKFVPAYRRISNIQAYIGANGELQGEFVIEIIKDEEVIASESISAAEVADGRFVFIPFEMWLEKGYPYILRISMKDNINTNGWVSVTKEGVYQLPEFDSVIIGDTQRTSQMIGGITYRTIAGKSTLMLYFLTAFWTIGTFYLCGSEMWEMCRKRNNKNNKK